MKSFESTLKVIASLVLISSLFVRCSDSEEPGSSEVSGSSVKGVVTKADVSVYAYAEGGIRGELLGSTTTDANGNFNLEVDHRGAVEVVVTGGSYDDEATGDNVALGSFELRTITIVDGDESVAVTALTTIAAEHIDAHAEQGLEIAIANANAAVASEFGIEGVDISASIPADLSLPAAASAGNAQLKYGAVQAGLSQQISSNGMNAEALLDLIAEMSADFRDGAFDGMNGEASLQFSLSITPEEASAGLDVAIDAFLSGSHNLSGYSSSDFKSN